MDEEVWNDALETLGSHKMWLIVSTSSAAAELQSLFEAELGLRFIEQVAAVSKVKSRYIKAVSTTKDLGVELTQAKTLVTSISTPTKVIESLPLLEVLKPLPIPEVIDAEQNNLPKS